VINIAADRQKFMTLTGELSWQRLRRSAFQGYWSKIAVSTYPTSLWRPVEGDPVWISLRSLASEN